VRAPRGADVVLVLVTLLFLLPLSEVVVRVVAPQRLPSQEQIRSFVLKDMYVADEDAGYRLAPGFSGRIERAGHVTEFRTNSTGQRGGELGPKTRPRILALGDSFTWGWGVGEGEEWIHVTGDELARRGGPDVQAVNGGVNGYGTESALALLREIGDTVKPDLVLLGFFANDYTDNLIGARNTYTVRDGYLFDEFSHEVMRESFLLRESHLYRMLKTAWETFRVRYLGGVPNASFVRDFSPADFEKGRDLSEQWILALRDECERLGAGFGVVWLPADVYALRGRQPQDIPLRLELQQRVAAAGIPSLDLLPVVLAEPRIPGLYLPGDGHFTVRGHRVAARAIAQWILDEGLLSPAS
jgi:lysophospholipase L1-like esterase